MSEESGSGARTIGAHPDEAVTAAYLDGTLPDEARDLLEAHLALCSPCRAGVTLLAERDAVEAGDAGPSPEMLELARRGVAPSSVALRPARSWFFQPAALAAAAVIAVVAGLWMRGVWSPAAPPVPIERGEEDTLRPEYPPAGALVESGAIAFAWSAVDGADRYIVTVQDAEGRTVATIESRSGGEQIHWPDGTALPAAGTYLWSVRALSLGRVLAETRPSAFQVR